MIKYAFIFCFWAFHSLAFANQICQKANITSTTPVLRFVIDEATVTDKVTGLMWRKCQEGMVGTACDSGAVVTMNWADALLYVSNVVLTDKGGRYGGHRDWRLPNIRELSSLAELQCASPAINREIFPRAQPIHVWSSSPYHFYTHYSWYVDFSNGAPTYAERLEKKGLWLVRDLNSD